MPQIAIATLVIIVANILISIKGFNDFSFFEKYKFNIASIRRGEHIRMFSSGFLHADFSHLLFNMLTLYFFAVTGILYAAILFVPNAKLYLFFAVPIPAWLFGVAYLLYSIYGMKNKVGNIGHDAHFGGAIAGYVLTLAFAPGLITHSTWIVVLLAVPILLLFILHKLEKL